VEREGIREALKPQRSINVVPVLTALSAAHSLANKPASVMIAGSELPTFEVNDLVEMLGRVRPGLPLLVIRKRDDEVPVHWNRPRIGVLWTPVPKATLARTVETVIGLGPGRAS
jgi:hypothetical protein